MENESKIRIKSLQNEELLKMNKSIEDFLKFLETEMENITQNEEEQL